MRRNPDLESFDETFRRLYFDTVLYNQESLELLFKLAGPDRCMFGSDRPATGSAVDPATGHSLDDIKPVIESIPWLSDTDRHAIFEGTAKSIYPGLTVEAAT
jgi:4-oxalmesaconate hydratase